mgnify:CR=1 FL=1
MSMIHYTSSIPDYTDEINKMLKEKEKKFSYYKSYKDNINESIMYGPEDCSSKTGFIMGTEIAKYYAFKKEVETRGPMDFKESNIWKEAFGPNVPQVPLFIYNGEVMDSATLGNVAYGYLGTYLEIPEKVLYIGGGFVNVRNINPWYLLAWNYLPNYGEAPEDIEAINKGINLYKSMNSNMSDCETSK